MKQFAFAYLAIIALFFAMVFTFTAIEHSKKIEKRVELRYEENYSLTYPETIEAYKQLDSQFGEAKLLEYGPTDSGFPLHLFVISKHKVFNSTEVRKKNFRVLLINNGIHPGEPCGVDASVKLAREILEERSELWQLLDSTVICIVPMYNIGGALNRSQYNRANQNGPREQGFRANAKNLDLNRDFAPMDSRNAQSFAQIFHQWSPHIFVDTHTSNGADYQYVMTLIEPHPLNFPQSYGNYYSSIIEPFMYKGMENEGYPMTPYVDPMGDTPESGIEQYVSNPRYGTGYGPLFNTFTFCTEAHMFKPFRERVLATYKFLVVTLNFLKQHGAELALKKSEANEFVKTKKQFVVQWDLDSTKVENFSFLGYEANYIPSKVTGGKRLKYDRGKPFTKPIPYYRHHNAKITIEKPDFYVISQAWHEAIHRLRINGVNLIQLKKDTTIIVEVYYVENYETYERPYNGHYVHNNVKVRKDTQSIKFYKGDYLISTNQITNEYIVQMLEPQSSDSFFAWNFFDTVLQRKEYFAPYIFEDYAEEFLKSNPKLNEEFELKKKTDKQFANNPYAQLSFIYQHSPFFEKVFMRYPVFRLFSN